MSEDRDYQIVQRPSKVYRGGGEHRYPIEPIVASADSGTAVRLYLPQGKFDVNNGAKTTASTRGDELASIRLAMRRRGYTLEWSRDPTSRDHVLVWAVRREEG